MCAFILAAEFGCPDVTLFSWQNIKIQYCSWSILMWYACSAYFWRFWIPMPACACVPCSTWELWFNDSCSCLIVSILCHDLMAINPLICRKHTFMQAVMAKGCNSSTLCMLMNTQVLMWSILNVNDYFLNILIFMSLCGVFWIFMIYGVFWIFMMI